MDTKDLKGLMEAYSEMYAPQEVDEAQRPVYGRGGGLQRTQTALQVLGKHATARDKKKLHNIPKGGTTARTGDSGKLMSGEYDRGKGSKAARRAAALTKPEPKKSFPNRLRRSDGQGIRDSYEYDIFDVVLEFLQVEGYAETLEEAEWLMANVINEEAIGIILGEEQLDEVSDRLARAARNTREKRYNASFGDGGMSANYSKQNAKKNMLNKTLASRAERTGSKIKPVDEEYVDEALTGDRYKKVMNKPGGTAYSRKVSADPSKRATRGGRGGESDFGAGDRGSGNKAARRAGTYQEDYVNEAQHARENPEKYEREQAKKSAPVRGERTPMPPRGDKRREDFEKWYAKQMGR